MKKLLFLLAAMGIVSASAMAEAPTLKVTGIGQELEIENTSGGSNVGEIVWFINSVDLEYGDWGFNLQGVKAWDMDTKNGIDSILGRAQLTATNQVTDNLALGARVRMQNDYDKYYGFYNYANGGFSSESWFWYTSTNGSENTPDLVGVEAWPLKYTIGNWGLAWYVTGEVNMGNTTEGKVESYLENQARVYWDFYQGEKLSLSAEYRLELDHTKHIEGGKAKDTEDESVNTSFGSHTLYLYANYNVTEALTVYGYYGYAVYDLEYVKDGSTCNDGNYYGDFGLGWTYSF